MEIVLASRNKKKIAELQAMMSKINGVSVKILSLDDIGVYDDIEENGETFEDNARIKASVGAKKGYITIADDSGLCVDALNGAPGVHSARFSGGGDDENNRLLQEKLKGLPKEKRGAQFVSNVVCIFPNQNYEIKTCGKVEGYITEEAAGTNGFGYDPYFFYEPFGKTFAQLSAEEKNSISHRGKAMEAFAAEFEKKVKEFNLN